MSHIIEPCCYEKQLTALLEEIEGKDNVAHFYSFSDWDLNVLLPFFVNRAPEGEVTLCLVHVEQGVLETLRKLLTRMIPSPETREQVPLVKHLSLITRGDNRKDILEALNGFGGRCSVCEDTIGFRCLTVANDKRQFVVQGSLNQQALSATQMFTLTTGKKLYRQAQDLLDSKVRVKAIKDLDAAYERLAGQD